MGEMIFFSVVMENLLDCSYRIHEMSNNIFNPFEINDSIDTPLTEVDPDIRISSSTQVFSTSKAQNVTITWKISLYRYLQKEIREQEICHFFILTSKAYPNIMRNWKYILTLWILSIHLLHSLKHGLMSINKACMNTQTTHRSTSLGTIKRWWGVFIYCWLSEI